MIERYQINYDWPWPQESGPFDTHVQITLVAHITSAAAAQAVVAWFQGLPEGKASHQRVDCGATMHIRRSTPASLDLAISAAGQDCCEMVTDQATVIADLVEAADQGNATLRWIELPPVTVPTR
ncbi:hypothetical protein KEM60_01702 [Austwickia sp. TVS 96-490-7B]|uniref:hypothetical protein n=1 Tax=Austwickia sp. TVS 96-490-7B TaxID=2830843 RepID=UPI001C573885|nr:hypothetical protein [Austwickia sp. TVS 96-490-7B]MBW3085502.1 hypothetical protein [Austwickia sp. TVS 96-490-7B]